MAREIPANRESSIELLYNPRQIEFLNLLDAYLPSGRLQFDRLSLFAGRRGGKTKIGGIAAAKLAMRRRCYGWVCAPTYVDLHDFVEPAVISCIPAAWIRNWSSEFRELTLRNGSVIAFRSLEDPEKARGPGLDWVWIDEGRKIQEKAYLTMRPAIASGGILKMPGIVILTTSPNGFDWCWKEFWKPAEEGEPGFWACKYKTIDNPSFDRAEYEREKRTMDPLFFQQEYEADFVTFTGAIYGGLLDPQVITSPEAMRALIPDWFDENVMANRTGIVGLDPGADHPFAGVLTVETPAGLVVCGEYEERNRPVRSHVDGLKQMISGATGGRGLDVQRWAMDRTQRQFFIELSQFGLFATEADNRVVDGIRRVQSWLAARRLWVYEPECRELVKKLRTYRWAENARKDGQVLEEKPLKKDDDLADALRYAVMGWPALPEWEMTSGAKKQTRRVSPDSQWSTDRMSRIAAAERAPKEPTNPIGEFYESRATRGYYLDDEDERSGEDEGDEEDTLAGAFWD